MNKQLLILSLFLFPLLFSSCSKEGCTDPIARNYDSKADEDDGSCNYFYGCMDTDAVNYDDNATQDDGTCEYEGSVMFWTDCNVCAEINVYIDNIYRGQVNGWYTSQPSAPNCSALYCVTQTLEPGSYSYSGQETSSGLTVSGSFTISPNECTIVGL